MARVSVFMVFASVILLAILLLAAIINFPLPPRDSVWELGAGLLFVGSFLHWP